MSHILKELTNGTNGNSWSGEHEDGTIENKMTQLTCYDTDESFMALMLTPVIPSLSSCVYFISNGAVVLQFGCNNCAYFYTDF